MKLKWIIAFLVAMVIAAGLYWFIIRTRDANVAAIQAAKEEQFPDFSAMTDIAFQHYKDSTLLPRMISDCQTQFTRDYTNPLVPLELTPEQQAYCECVSVKFVGRTTKENMVAYTRDKTYQPFTEEESVAMAEECADETR